MSHDLPTGVYRLRNVRTGTALDLWDGRSDPGTKVQGYQAHGGDNQKWILKWTGIGHEVTFQNVKSKTYIGAPGEIADNVQVVGTNKAVPFILVKAESGYILQVASNGKVLSVRGGESANETPVIFYHSNEADDQKWYFEGA
ncbi:hypothetical protein RSOLAG22IIIB_06423 [Rhizoctonia solani]|uniref:Ricin B lectin domain-containing protein n=1 Tax=Rhizoctonia solani TaxID=456999 RepID=A0A0K6GEU2_9AGAM|nr:hypothetical protein RSOLAG22IIIB_06423 [Rhizoctonia solani]